MTPIIHIAEEDFEIAMKTLRLANVKYQVPQTEQVADLDTKEWIVLPQEFSGRDYALHFDPARLNLCPAVEKAGRELKINYQNTSRDSLGRNFVGDNNWFDSLRLNLALGADTSDLGEFADELKLLLMGMRGKTEVYTVGGAKLEQEVLKRFFYDITKTIAPWRAEWIGSEFKIHEAELYADSRHIYQDGKLFSQVSEVLDKDTLIQDRTPGISLDDWLKNPTKQGLPRKNTKKGDLFYWFPRRDNNSVARFYADSHRVLLNCGRGPSLRASDLGVRAVKRSK